ncbi:uncharacterized protein LOC144715762 [Wolffia australiana]
MAESPAISSSSVATQSLQGSSSQPGKHSIVTALTKPAYVFDGSNYGPWRGAFLEFLNAHSLRHHLTDPPPKDSDPEFSEWSRLESAVCSWLISSVATQIMEPLSMTVLRALWLVETMYANKSNVSRTVRLYEELFACRQVTRTLQSYYGAFEAIFTNLDVYQPLVLDIDALNRYRNELRAGAFLSGLRPELADMIRGQGNLVRLRHSWHQEELPGDLGGEQRGRRNTYPSCKYWKTSHLAEKCWKEFGKPGALARTRLLPHRSHLALADLLDHSIR